MSEPDVRTMLAAFMAEDERRRKQKDLHSKLIDSLNEVYRGLLNDKGVLRDDVRYFEEYGGRRSAKSHDGGAGVLAITALFQPGHFIPCIRKVGATLKDSVFAELLGFFRENGIDVYVNKTDKEIVLPNGSRFRCFGLDDPAKHKSLKDATIIWLEEADEATEEDFDTLDAGLSPKNYKGRIVITHNPMPRIPGAMHWLERRFLQVPHERSKITINEDANALVLRTWYKDNRFCPPEVVKVLEGYEKTNPDKYKLWALGEFTRVEGAVFDNWDTVPCVPEGIVHDSIGVGLDFGFSADPAAAVRGWVRDREIWLKLLVYKTELYNDDLYNALKDAGVLPNDPIVADSARPDIIGDLGRMGLQGIIPVKKYTGYKEDVVSRLKGYKIHLIEGDTALIREFSTYSWARDRLGSPLPKLQDGDDHGIDCVIMMMAEYVNRKTFAWEL